MLSHREKDEVIPSECFCLIAFKVRDTGVVISVMLIVFVEEIMIW